jgi:hypothetical protein
LVLPDITGPVNISARNFSVNVELRNCRGQCSDPAIEVVRLEVCPRHQGGLQWQDSRDAEAFVGHAGAGLL